MPHTKKLTKLVGNSLAVSVQLIERRIYLIRGQKVMIDVDLAELYGVQTKRLNERVRRNSKRFPKDFMFPINEVRSGKLEVAICDLKIRPWWATHAALCLYRARRRDVIDCPEQRAGH